MVTNGVSRDIKVSSSYWVGNKLPGDDYENNLLVTQAGFQFVRFWLAETVNKSASNCNRLKYCSETECSFDVNTTYTRTPTFDWFNEYNEHGNYELKIIDSKLRFYYIVVSSLAPSRLKGAGTAISLVEICSDWWTYIRIPKNTDILSTLQPQRNY